MSLAAIRTWRTQDAPENYRKLLETIDDPEERAEFVWVTRVPTEEHMQFWWGGHRAGGPPRLSRAELPRGCVLLHPALRRGIPRVHDQRQ